MKAISVQEGFWLYNNLIASYERQYAAFSDNKKSIKHHDKEKVKVLFLEGHNYDTQFNIQDGKVSEKTLECDQE